MAQEVQRHSTSSMLSGNLDSTKFGYKPLAGGDAFRLLRILPKLTDTPSILCELIPTTISRERGKYIAGSYVWGPPEPTTSIILDGTAFHVRENLLHLLRACRSKIKPRIMWIDAICINQNDIQERNCQVRLMGQIYKAAQCIYCWLGWKANMWLGICKQAQIGDKLRPVIGKNDQQINTALRLLAQSEYWSRMWILQEFLLAKEIYLLAGMNKVPYRQLDRLLKMRAASGVSFDKGLEESDMFLNLKSSKSSRILQMRRFREDSVDPVLQVPWDLESLFEAFGAMGCSVAQDRIFSLIGLAQECAQSSRLGELIDYDLTVWQLLRRILEVQEFWSPVRFTHKYAVDVIGDAQDQYMKDSVTLTFKFQPHIRLLNFLADACRDSTQDSSQPHFCVGSIETHSRYLEGGASMTGLGFSTTVFLYAWSEWSSPTYILLCLSQTHPRHELALPCDIWALLEPCKDACAIRCTGHAIIGFAIVASRSAFPTELDNRMWLKSEAARKLFTTFPSRNHTQLHANLQFKALPEAIHSYRTTIKVRKVVEDRYSLETDLNAFVRLSQTLINLEEAFGLEFKP